MKKYLIFVVIALYSCFNPSFADTSLGADLWDVNGIEQKGETRAVSDEEFEQALQKVDKKVNKWKNWAKKKKLPKGQEFSQSNETEMINNEQGDKASPPVVCIPVELKVADGIIPVGHYQVEGEKINDNIILTLYQAHNAMAKIQATETEDDYDKEEILFADIVPLENNKVKIIYGSLDFNAFAVIDVVQ